MSRAVDRWPLAFLFLVNPLLLLPFVADPALARWLVAAAVLAVVFLVSAQSRLAVAATWTETWPLVGLAGLLLWHMGRGAPVAEGSRWLVLVVLGGLTYAYSRGLDRASRDRGLELMVMAGGALGVYAVLQAAGWDVLRYPAESWMYRVVTTFGHRNFTAAFLLATVFAALSRADRTGTKNRAFSPFLWPILAGLLATGSRFPIVAAAVVVVVSLVRRRVLRTRSLVVVVVVAVLAVGVLISSNLGWVVSRMETISLRAELYRTMVPLLGGQPLFGGGAGAFASAIPELAGPTTAQASANLAFLHAHLLPAELQIELGLAGILLAAAFVAPLYLGLVRQGWRRWDWLVWGHLAWLVVSLYDTAPFSYAGWISLWPMLGFIRSDLQGEATNAIAKTAVRRAFGWLAVPAVCLCLSLIHI